MLNKVLVYFKGADDGNGDEGVVALLPAFFSLSIQLRGSGFRIILGGGGDGVASDNRPTERAAA